MIKSILPDVDQGLYCYDTGLTFGLDVGLEILKQVDVDETYFPRRHNYNHGTDPKQLTRLIGATKTREIIRRQQQIAKTYPNQAPIDFRQYFFDEIFKQKMMQQVPDYLKLEENTPNFMLQVASTGSILPAHKGHHRTCSLFMLLESDQQETHWYRNTQDFEVIDPLRIPDLDKIEHVVTAVMEPFKWYIFNHFEWHSVHKYSPGQRRISIGVDFFSIKADELLELIVKNESV